MSDTSGGGSSIANYRKLQTHRVNTGFIFIKYASASCKSFSTHTSIELEEYLAGRNETKESFEKVMSEWG